VATPAVAAPVTVRAGAETFAVSREAIADSLVLKADKTGKITPRVSESKLRSALAD